MNDNYSTFIVKIEYEDKPIRHIAVKCPNCNSWFYGNEITNKSLMYEDDLYSAQFVCPLCHSRFQGDPVIEESCYPEIYDGCHKRKIVWE